MWVEEVVDNANPNAREPSSAPVTALEALLRHHGRTHLVCQATRERCDAARLPSDDVPEHLLQHLPCLPRLFIAVEEVGIDAEGDLTGGVAELARDEGDVRPAGDEEAGEGVPKIVPPDRLELGFFESGLQRSQADVGCVVWRPCSRREHVVVGLVEACLRLVLAERLSQRGHENDVTHGALRLRRYVPSLSI